MLDVQYRMHPEIRLFPSTAFYNDGLKDAPGMAESTTKEWHTHRYLGPFAFHDIRGAEAVPESGASIKNDAEAKWAVGIVKHMLDRYPSLK